MNFSPAVLEYGPQEYRLSEYNTIGRHAKNTVRIHDPRVSGHHAVILFDPRLGFVIKDNQSRNGTHVNGARIIQEARLNDGDKITIGDTECRFRMHNESSSHMVRIEGAGGQSEIYATIAPSSQKRFLPEARVADNAVIRADYEKLRIAHELQRDIGLRQDIDLILAHILDRTFEFLHCDRGVIALVDDCGAAVTKAYKSRTAGETFVISSTLIRHVLEKKEGVMSRDMKTDERFSGSESLIVSGVRSTLAVPIMDTDTVLGVIVLDSSALTSAFAEKDLALLANIANQTSRIIINATLHAELKESFDSAIGTLAATVDARHPLTLGHSERVTEYALMIARHMGLDENDIGILQYSALLHDIGKIGVPDSILLKKGSFTDEERREINRHPEKTRGILQKFHFPKALREVPVIAAYHHEKMNGEGYPEGLRGEQLPTLSRILAVADVFDALTSRRDYPKYGSKETFDTEAMPLEKALAIIKEGSGSHFDPDVLDAFYGCLPRMLFRMRGTHFRPEYVDKTIRALDPGLLPSD